ncbi:MAG: hypothetical protein AAB402_03630 [Patescibacteria group bacterium]
MARKYYSLRKDHSQKISLDSLKEIVFSIWQDFSTRGYFQEFLGTNCTDGDIPGKVGTNIEGYVLRRLRRANVWPFSEKYKGYSEDDLFDIIEFFFDHISLPLEQGATYHNWNSCGWHYTRFDDLGLGPIEFAQEINQFLNDYGDGFELSTKGEILTLLPSHLRNISESPVPTGDVTVREKMEHAANKFRKYGSTISDREDAIRALADCFEHLKPKIEKVLNSKDESDLFNIANNFGIRHANKQQKTNYDKTVWLSWMFYFYYATLLACLHLIKKNENRIKYQKDDE